MHTKKNLLIVAHTPSPNTQFMADAILRGASHEDIENIHTICLSPLDTQPEDVINADAIILSTTENLAYMSGLMKDFFDRVYYPCLEKTQGLPSATVIRAGSDGTGTKRAIESILTGLRWKPAREPLICRGEFQESFIIQCEELGQYMAAGLELGIL